MKEDDDFDDPSVSDPSSVVLLLIGCLSSVCTLYCVVCMLRFGMKSQHAELTMCLHLSMALWSLSMLPFIYTSSHICQLMGFVQWYSLLQLVISSTLMMWSASDVVEQSQYGDSSQISNSQHKITNYSRFWLYVFPALPPIFPLVSNSFGHFFSWCSLDLDAQYAGSCFVLLFVSCWVPVFFILFKFLLIVRVLRNSSLDLCYKVILRGPVLYGSATLFVFIVAAVLCVVAGAYSGPNATKELYFGQYGVSVCIYLLGICYGIIFIGEYEHVKAFEMYVRDLFEFEKEFCISVDVADDTLSNPLRDSIHMTDM